MSVPQMCNELQWGPVVWVSIQADGDNGADMWIDGNDNFVIIKASRE